MNLPVYKIQHFRPAWLLIVLAQSGRMFQQFTPFKKGVLSIMASSAECYPFINSVVGYDYIRKPFPVLKIINQQLWVVIPSRLDDFGKSSDVVDLKIIMSTTHLASKLISFEYRETPYLPQILDNQRV